MVHASCDNGRVQVLSDWLGFDSAREQELQREGAFGL
jgi:hypothetical protein